MSETNGNTAVLEEAKAVAAKDEITVRVVVEETETSNTTTYRIVRRLDELPHELRFEKTDDGVQLVPTQGVLNASQAGYFGYKTAESIAEMVLEIEGVVAVGVGPFTITVEKDPSCNNRIIGPQVLAVASEVIGVDIENLDIHKKRFGAVSQKLGTNDALFL